MNSEQTEKERCLRAQKRLKNLKLFYIHLIGYIILVGLLAFNLYIIDESPYETSITWLNYTTIVVWTIFIFLHGLKVFRGRLFFKKSWEDQKVEEYIKKSGEHKTDFWE